MTQPIYVGDYGMPFVFTAQKYVSGIDLDDPDLALTAIDISSHDSLRIDFVSPSGTLVSYTDATNLAVTLTTDGTDGKFQVLGSSSLFDAAGIWKRQGHVIFPASSPTRKWSSEVIRFEVFDGLS